MASKPKQNGPSHTQKKLEKAQLAATEAQLAELERQRAMPTPEAPKPLPPMAPSAMQSTADLEQAGIEARRQALRRNSPGRSTIFAGETGAGNSLGGRKTLLG